MQEKLNIEVVDTLQLLEERVKFGDVKLLSDVELLTLIVSGHYPKSRTTTQSIQSNVEDMLDKLGGNLSSIADMGCSKLMRTTSVSMKLAAALLSMVELSARIKSTTKSDIDIIRNSKDIFTLLSPKLSSAIYEEFWVAYLAGNNRVVECVKISHGGVESSNVDVRLIIKIGLNNLSSKIILAHNHPSGSLAPSDRDLDLTTRVTNAAKLFDILVVDHVIFTKDDYYSFSDNLLLSYKNKWVK